jgi:hypothetical protein
VIRQEAERAECLQGFQFVHSIGGGTGSGIVITRSALKLNWALAIAPIIKAIQIEAANFEVRRNFSVERYFKTQMI